IEIAPNVAKSWPATLTELTVAAILESMLNVQAVGLDDDFFELGANSLTVGALVNRFHKETGLLLSIRDIFAASTVRGIAAICAEKAQEDFRHIERVAPQAGYPMSSAQRRLWVLSQFEEGSIAYNIHAAYSFVGNLDKTALEYSFSRLFDRHEILRTVFREDDGGEIKQFVLEAKALNFNIRYDNLSELEDKERTIGLILREEYLKPFDLAQDCLVRVRVIQTDAQNWIFSCTVHHIISDGWSMDILMSELLMLYASYNTTESIPLTPLKIQYKDYASWELNALKSERLRSDREYWLKVFEGELPVLDLAGDKVRPAVKTYNGSTLLQPIDHSLQNA
ncbi:MAG: condensation domain-containing protein, partial [Cyclobacteriaceae bacterium]